MTKLGRRIKALEDKQGDPEEVPTIDPEKLTQAQRIRILAAHDAGTFPESLSDEDLSALLHARIEPGGGACGPKQR